MVVGGLYDLHMSFDLAVWVGSAPTSDAAATEEFIRRRQVIGQRPKAPPAPQIRNLVEDLLARFPDLDDDDAAETSPWSTSPLIDEAIGDFIYFPMTFSGTRDHGDAVIEIIASHRELICFDPQSNSILTPRPLDR